MRKFLAFILVFLFLSFSRTASAQLMVERGKVFKNVAPGETISDTLVIHNNGGEKVSVNVYMEDFVYTEPFDGSKKFLPAGTAEHSVFPWLRFEPHELDLPAFGKEVVHYTIKAPPEAQGGYYGVMFFENMPESKQEFTGVKVITRVGTLFFIETTNKKKEVSVKKVQWHGGKVTGRMINKGDTILVPQGVYYILDEGGIAVDRGQVAGLYIPPGEDAGFHLNLSPQLADGKYTLVLTFDLEEGQSKVIEMAFLKSRGNFRLMQIRD